MLLHDANTCHFPHCSMFNMKTELSASTSYGYISCSRGRLLYGVLRWIYSRTLCTGFNQRQARRQGGGRGGGELPPYGFGLFVCLSAQSHTLLMIIPLPHYGNKFATKIFVGKKCVGVMPFALPPPKQTPWRRP